MSNPFLKSFAETVALRYPTDAKNMTISEWIVANTRHPRAPGKPFSFEGYEFQVEIANDLNENVSVIKPSQIGLSEIQIRKALAFLTRNRGTSLIFTLPTGDMMKRLSKTRVRPLIQNERVFQQMEGDKGSQAMDLFELPGNSFLYIVGANEGAATSIPADAVFNDEVDLSDQRLLGLFNSRLQASKWKLKQRFSTPTHAGFGIDALYAASDQREYMHQCSACNHWQVPLFHLNHLHLPGYDGDGDVMAIDVDTLARIDLPGCYVKCTKCGAALDLLNASRWEWVAKHPGRHAHGYRVRPFCTESLSLKYVLTELTARRTDDMKGFVNTVLGEPFSDSNSKLTAEAIRRVMKGAEIPEIGGSVRLAIGIDMGLTCHLVLGVIKGDVVHPVYFELVPMDMIVDRVKAYLTHYNIVCGAIDRFPYTPTANEIMRASKGKIVPTEYRGTKLVNIVKDEYDEVSHAQVNRTGVIDRVVKLILSKGIEMSGYQQHSEVLLTHLQNMVRVDVPEKEAVWQKVSEQDHFFHALALLQVSPRIKDIVTTNFMESARVMMPGFAGVNVSVDRAPRGALFGEGRRASNPTELP